MAHTYTKRPTAEQRKKYAKYLAHGEEMVAVFGIGDRYYWANLIALIPLSLVIVGLPFLFKLIHKRHGKVYILTDRRVLIRDGVLSVKTISAPYDKITHISVKEDFLEKFSYNMGHITIHTAGPTPVEIDLINVQNPLEVKNLIEELIVKERSIFRSGDKKSIIRPLG